MTAPRPPVSGPPTGFRPHMPLSVKLRAALIALGLDPDAIDFDHDPPLALRIWDEAAQDTRPPANDPRHIRPLARQVHRERTARVDVPAIAKVDRLTETQQAFRSALLAKTPGTPRKLKGSIQSRPFRRKR